MKNGQISFWQSRPGVMPTVSPELDSNLEVDVAIVGGGLTGLWTAWALKSREPDLEVAVLEAEEVGFGASGRNGGWLSGKPVGLRHVLAKLPTGRSGVLAADQVLERSIHEIVEILGADQIGAAGGGWMQVATTASQMGRIEDYLKKSRSWGVSPEDLRLMSAAEVTDRVAISGALGALYSPDCYRVDPVLMINALAKLVTDSGVTIFEHSRVGEIRRGHVRVGNHTVRAQHQIVVATEAYSFWEPGQRRRLLPLNSSMIVTDPLDDDQWAHIGWRGAECVSGTAHTYFYAQRTVDGRIAIGGRGKPYRFASQVDDRGRVDELRDVHALEDVLNGLFPGLSAKAAHAWCGVLGVSRDWSPFIDQDLSTGVTHVGGYAGQGLTAAYVAGQATADLILHRNTELTALPWVRSMPRRWEPEPLRWIGATALYRAYRLADRLEDKSGSPRTSWVAQVADRVAGR
ncbi:NAD(P)/FAD-dependent oxidoreductase [Rhodococcus sp. NPDC057014]|uniref:NAD(P)/FAD-dependent oxidoreductase n=1 Tax=Rhodococcus sp. NPDC057014 TaxID=3346000 RepID=UPI00363D4E55